MNKFLILFLASVMTFEGSKAFAQSPIEIDFSDPSNFSNYVPGQLGQYIGTYIGPHSYIHNGPIRVNASAYYCYPNPPGYAEPTRCGTTEGAFAYSFGLTQSAGIKKATVNVVVAYAYKDYGGDFRISATCSGPTCTSACVISGAQKTNVYPDSYVSPEGGAAVTIDCPGPISNISYVNSSFHPSVPGSYTFTRSIILGDATPVPKVELAINQLRVGQRVFEPSASSGASTDLVTKKPYAVEVTLSATVPSQHRNLEARADLFVDGIHRGESVIFKVGDIVSGASKVHIFYSEQIAGAKNLRVDVMPVESKEGIFDTTASVNRLVNFYDVNLSLYVATIDGCLPNFTCFSPTNQRDRDAFNLVELPSAENILPISGGGLRVVPGPSWSASKPNSSDGSRGVNGYLVDLAQLTLRKRLAGSNFGVYLVSENYFAAHEGSSGINTNGLVITDHPGVLLIRGRYTSGAGTTLAHEIIHATGFIEHSGNRLVEGIGFDVSQIWTSDGVGLADNMIFDEIQPGPYGPAQSMERSIYNRVFNAFMTPRIDPKVIHIAGVVDASSKFLMFEAIPAEGYLENSLPNGNVIIQGLDRSGKVISSIVTRSANNLEILREGEKVESIQTSSSLFAATIPDDGTITQVRVIKDGKTILTKSLVQTPTVEVVIRGLGSDDFKTGILAKLNLAAVRAEYELYLKFKGKGKKKEALSSLKLLRETLRVTLKSQIELSSGIRLSISEVLAIIDTEIKSQ